MDDADMEFQAFVQARWPTLRRFAFGLTGDVGYAEDLVQTALVRCYRHWKRIHPDRRDAYVRRAILNVNTSRGRRQRITEMSLASAPEPAAEDHTLALAIRDEVWRALRRLPARMRAILVLRYLEDMSEAEVALTLGCSVGSVKSQTSRGLARLRSVLEAVEGHLRVREGSR